MKRAHADTQTPSRRGRRRIAAERILSSADDPGVTVIEANRCDNAFRAAGDELEPSTIKSAHRVLRIFVYFAEIQRPAAMTEIARSLYYPTSSTSVLLKCLVDLGYLNSDSRMRTYVPTARISLIGSWLRDRILPGGNLEKIIHELHDSTQLTTFVASRNGLYSQYIYVLQGTTSVRFYLEPGSLRLLTQSTPGRVLLSLMSDNDVQRIVLRINVDGLAAPPIQFTDLQSALATIRRQGFAYTRNRGTPGLSTIAMQLPATPHAGALAIAVAGSSEKIDAEASAIISKMRDLIETEVPGTLVQIDPSVKPRET
jgi:DNA-binding IclR family transcriptional regulator